MPAPISSLTRRAFLAACTVVVAVTFWPERIAFGAEGDMKGEDIAITLNCRLGTPQVVGSHVLPALGRRPNTGDLCLDAAGVATDEHGFIVVDDELRTSPPGIWALGDCNGRGAFTHTSYNDFEIVAVNLLDGDARRVSDRIPAYALYIASPLGGVGLTETETRRTGRKLLVGTRPMTRVGRAVERGETQGFMKVVADAETEQILGASILGTSGDGAIHGILDAMNAKTSYSTLQRAVPIHSTVSELILTPLSEMRPMVPSSAARAAETRAVSVGLVASFTTHEQKGGPDEQHRVPERRSERDPGR